MNKRFGYYGIDSTWADAFKRVEEMKLKYLVEPIRYEHPLPCNKQCCVQPPPTSDDPDMTHAEMVERQNARLEGIYQRLPHWRPKPAEVSRTCPSCNSPDTVDYWSIKGNRDASYSYIYREYYPNARKCVDCEHVWW